MFPGLQLSNDDDIVNPHKMLQVRNSMMEVDEATTFHIDIRFQMAFTQMFEIVDYVNSLLERNRRVVVEHFNLLYPALGRNADIIVGIGEEIIVTRPSLFGPHLRVFIILCIVTSISKNGAFSRRSNTEVLHETFDIMEEEYFFLISERFVIKFHKKPDDLESQTSN